MRLVVATLAWDDTRPPGTAPALQRDMSAVLALLAERDAALRDLMRQAVRRAGYDVLECSNPLQLKVELRSSSVVEARGLLVILSTDLASQCAGELTTLLRARSHAGLAAVHAAFTCEFGAPQQPPAVGGYELVGVLEKPFELGELERIARGCHALSRPTGAESGSG